MRTIDILYEWSGKVLNMHAVTYESDGVEEGALSKECSLAEPFSLSSVIHQNMHAKNVRVAKNSHNQVPRQGEQRGQRA